VCPEVGKVAARWAEIEGGSLIAHRAYGTTYAAHSLELKVEAQQASLKLFLKINFKRTSVRVIISRASEPS